jgi:hypothetical protein
MADTIWGLLGLPGEGKTEFLAYLGFLFQEAGTTIHSNIHLKYPYQHIHTIEELSELPLEGDRLFLLDELWASADSYDFTGIQSKRDVQLLTRFLFQCRKVDAFCVHSNQTFEQLAPRIRRVTALLLRPRIILSFNEITREFTTDAPHPSTHISPYLMNVKFFDTFDRYLGFDEPYIVYPAHIFYDTREKVKPTPSINTNRLYEKYKDFEGTKEELISVFVEIEKMSRSESRMKANFILACSSNPLLLKLLKERND